MRGDQYSDYRRLKNAGAQVQDTNQIRFNSGSETTKHAVAKTIVGDVGRKSSYRVSSEVEVPQGEIDVLLWGHPERLTLAVELETDPTPQVKKSKLNRYVRKVEPVDDMALINVSELSSDIFEARETIRQELGL